MNLEKFFNPKSVAVIGATAEPAKVGYAVMKNLMSGGQRKIFSVNPAVADVLGLRSYKSVADIPEEIDLAVIAVRADIVASVMEECAMKKIQNVIVISAGFGETGAQGKNLEKNIKEIAERGGISFLGPNCFGVINTHSGLNTTFAGTNAIPGKIAVLSQSGALQSAMLDFAKKENIGFSKFISLGNEADLNESDFLEYLAEDSETEAVLMYLERVGDGKRFMSALSKATAKKPVAILRAGRSVGGQKAAASHTGSLAPQDAIFESALSQSGAVSVDTILEFFNIAKLFNMGILKSLPRLAVLTNAGGPSIVATDYIELSQSLSLAELSENAKSELKKVLPSMAALGNPIDVIGDAGVSRYEYALKILCAENSVDGILSILTPQMMTEAEATAEAIVVHSKEKPILPVFLGGEAIAKGVKILYGGGLNNFDFPEDAVIALDLLARKAKKMAPPKQVDAVSAEPLSPKMLSFSETKKILHDYNLDISGEFAKSKDEIASIFQKLGEGSKAVKIISEDIVHKTDAGAVRLNVQNFSEAEKFWTDFENKSKFEGILIQPMLSGREVIIGMKRDAIFGPTILFGLGGIYAEAMNDTALRIAPVEKSEALKVIEEIKGISILNGIRGEKAVNFDAIAQIIANLSRLALEHPEIHEIDLNPIMADPSSAVIIDCRLINN